MNKVYRCGYCKSILKDGRRYYCNDYCMERLAGSQRIDEGYLFVTEYDDFRAPAPAEPVAVAGPS